MKFWVLLRLACSLRSRHHFAFEAGRCQEHGGIADVLSWGNTAAVLLPPVLPQRPRLQGYAAAAA